MEWGWGGGGGEREVRGEGGTENAEGTQKNYNVKDYSYLSSK